MERVRLNVGDTAYCYDSDHPGELRPYKVVHIFELWDARQHVIEIPTHIDSMLCIRNDFLVSDSPDRPIGLWRRL